MAHRYLVALGSNQRHLRHGSPRAVIAAALAALEQAGLRIAASSPVVSSLPVGPSARRYANAAAVIEAVCEPDELLARLQDIEDAFGRCRRGEPWRARVLDLDAVLWDGGCWAGPGLIIPHAAFRERRFVLDPAVTIAGHWRDPLSGLTLRQLRGRLAHPRPAIRESSPA